LPSTLGHNHPVLVAAIAAQAGRLLHSSNLYRIPQQEQLADKLATLAGMDEVFFCNSGCEANEAAIKLARFYGHQQGVDSPAIVVMEKAFHGRTMATLSATGNRKAQAGFEPLVSGFVRVRYNDLEAIKGIARSNKNVVAVMLEIVQGEGGVNIADVGFQRGLRALCDEKSWLLICDEVQCGTGRTGTWFAFQHAGYSPGRGDAGQGARRRRADRRLPDGRQGEGPVQAGQSRVYFRRQPTGDDGGADDHRRDREGRPDRATPSPSVA
jgi:acetylornithine/N-succinyldiaminopimelate aminotransferase